MNDSQIKIGVRNLKLLNLIVSNVRMFVINIQTTPSLAIKLRCKASMDVSNGRVPPQKIWIDACSPETNLFLTPSRGSKAWFMEDVRSICCKNSLTSTRATLFVVRMWLKHHLLSLRIQYHGRLGRKPVTFFARKRAETSPKCKPLRD